MKFVYLEGTYKEYRGYVFANGKPATIVDKATEEALLKNPAFRKVEDEKVEVKETAEAPVLASDACRKCGKVVKQGRYMHEKFCRSGK